MTDDHGDEPIEKLLSPTALAVLLDISRRHLDDLRREDSTFPKPVMLGRLPRWRPTAIRRWLDGSAEPSDAALIEPSPAQAVPRARRGKAVARVY